jgi:inhibitor of cysteine peptidase
MQPASTRRQFHAALWRFPVTLLFLALSAPSAFAATKVVSDADRGATVEIKMGDVLEVRLSSNPSTGYMWYLHKQSTALLKLTSQSETEATQPGVGRPIVQIFEFAPKAKGTGVLLLHYVRSWEAPSASEEQFDLHVTIE